MKALQILHDNRLGLVSRESVPLGPWEARVSVAISLVCGSDMKNIRLSSSEGNIPGHEFSGIITEVSSLASGILCIGERVTAFPMMPCHSCLHCEDKDFRDCTSKESLGGNDWPGSFATEIIIDARMAVTVPPELTLEQGAMLEHLCCSYRLAVEIVEDNHAEDSHILIVGDGPIALANLQMLNLKGFQNITVLGKHEFRLNMAKELGAREVVNVVELDKILATLRNIDICVLSAQADYMLSSLSSKFHFETITIEQTRILDTELKSSLVLRGFKFRRAFAYHLSDFDSVVQLITAGSIKTDHLVTSRFSLEEFGAGYPNILLKANNIKVAVVSDQVLFESRNKG